VVYKNAALELIDESIIDDDLIRYAPKTYIHASLVASSYIDFIRISASLSDKFNQCNLLEDMLNLLDHVPVSITLLGSLPVGVSLKPLDGIAGVMSNKATKKRLIKVGSCGPDEL